MKEDRIKNQSQMKESSKFSMIQNHFLKYKKLKENLFQAQKLTSLLKQEVLSIGSEANAITISISKLTTHLAQLNSLTPQKQRQLSFLRQQQKHLQYKLEKAEIKLKQYEQRRKRFQQMHSGKLEKNTFLQGKIAQLQRKIAVQKKHQIAMVDQICLLSKNQLEELTQIIQETQIYNLCARNSIKHSLFINPVDEKQLEILNEKSKLKKMKLEKEQFQRKNTILRSNLSKIEGKIQEINQFFIKNSVIPHMSSSKNPDKSQQQQVVNNQIEKEFNDTRILKVIQNQHSPLKQQLLEKQNSSRVAKLGFKLPNNIISNTSSFQTLKSKTLLLQLIQKHDKISTTQEEYLTIIYQNSVLMNELSQINAKLQTQIIQENGKISSVANLGKKYAYKKKKQLF